MFYSNEYFQLLLLRQPQVRLLPPLIKFINLANFKRFNLSSKAKELYYRSKIVCSCLMNEMEENEAISCPNKMRINIINGYLFDSGQITQAENCTSILGNVIVLKVLKEDLQNFCSSSSNCSITKSFIINAKGDYTKTDCLSAEIYWNCFQNPCKDKLELIFRVILEYFLICFILFE